MPMVWESILFHLVWGCEVRGGGMGGCTDAESTSELKGQFHVGITIVFLHRAV